MAIKRAIKRFVRKVRKVSRERRAERAFDKSIGRVKKQLRAGIKKAAKRDRWKNFKKQAQRDMPLRDADDFYKSARKGALIVKKTFDPRNWQLGSVKFIDDKPLRGMSKSYDVVRSRIPRKVRMSQLGRRKKKR